MMKDVRARLVAYVQPPGVTWVSNDGAADLRHIYMNIPTDYRYAVVEHKGQFEIIDFHKLTVGNDGWFMPELGNRVFNNEEAAVVAAALIHDV